MLIHSTIRHEVGNALSAVLPPETEIVSGRPPFLDIDEQPLTVAVFLDDIVRQEQAICSYQWTATLNITVYLKSVGQGEDELDAILEMIGGAVLPNDKMWVNFETDNNIPATISYEQDAQQATWYTATMQLGIAYFS